MNSLNAEKRRQQEAHRQAVLSGNDQQREALLRNSSGFAAAVLDAPREAIRIRFGQSSRQD